MTVVLKDWHAHVGPVEVLGQLPVQGSRPLGALHHDKLVPQLCQENALDSYTKLRHCPVATGEEFITSQS